jgi:hypothetical protein
VEETKSLMQMRDVPNRGDNNNFNTPSSPQQNQPPQTAELGKFSSNQPLNTSQKIS